jgi:transposase-like protein
LDFGKTRPHRTLGLRNLEHLKNSSIPEWLKEQEQRWKCSNCGRRLHWYAEKCPDCGNPFFNATEEARAI